MENKWKSWADKTTEVGMIESLISPIISGGATDEDVDTVVKNIQEYIKERFHNAFMGNPM